MEAPPGFEPGIEVLQIWRGRASCCLVLGLVGPAPPFCRVLGPYWTPLGLRLPVSPRAARSCRLAYSARSTGPGNRHSPIRRPDPCPLGRHEWSPECRRLQARRLRVESVTAALGRRHGTG